MLVGGDEHRQLQRLLLVYDGSTHSQPALDWAVCLQRNLPGELSVLAVRDGNVPPPEWLSQIEARLDHDGLTDYRFVQRNGRLAA